MVVKSDDVQRLFLQSVLSRGILSESLAKVIWKKCAEAVKIADEDVEVVHSNTEEAWDAFIQNINSSLNDLDFEFKSIQDENTGKRLFAMVNRKDDELAQVATDYNAVEITYFKAVVEQIMLARNECFSVSSLAALREVSAGKEKINLTKAQAEVLLGSFVANGWLLRSKRGRYSLSSRALLELLPYLKSTYPDEIIECTICHEIITKGIACKRDNCKTRMHYHCFKVYRRRKGTCPACSLDWPQNPTDNGLLAVGELAIRDGDDKRQSRDDSDDGEDEDMEDDEPVQTQAKPRQQRSQSGRKGKSKKVDVESEEDAEKEDTEEETEADATPPPRRKSTRH
ncbi:Nse1 non-SMC component of SMC5-6 complex-domain-containing protein [Rhodocollybia butyracea]|uniref:Non-structural maintenance of chromosomes element 1 homolog n=1 Tax=Rhodocollybia butyracea TaxID=206335 RepID=A0A9P5U8H1_9AGAR|nr:Nse1 non-SMC component of SMC5-6 complex-domain-containing protein [Rhodocollybia butyracea]